MFGVGLLGTVAGDVGRLDQSPNHCNEYRRLHEPSGGGDDMSQGALEGIRIVDLGGSIAGMAATMVLAEMGADVVLVEPVGGSHWRSLPGFVTWNRSKRSVTLDVDEPSDRQRLDELLAGADVFVHSFGPTRSKRLGLDDASLANRHQHLIVASIIGWPINHPDADLPVDDMLTLARLGICDEQLGRREGPIFVRFPLGTWPATWLAAIGIVTRLIVRGRTGVAGPAHTSLAQGALIPMMMHWSRAETPSEMLAYGMPKHDMRASLFECSDGRWIHVMPPNPDHTPLMQEVFAEMGDAAVEAANRAVGDRIMRGYPNFGANGEAFKRRPARQWLDHFWANDIPVQEATQFGAILSDEQARENRYVLDLDDPTHGRITVAGHPVTLDPPANVVNPAPAVPGDHRALADVIASWPQRALIATDTGAPSARFPLEGLKVLDFGNFLAGPLGPMLLADLGATVVKVETTTGDPMRPGDWPFAGCQRNKRAVALNIKSPASRPALEALLKWADVVHHNLRRPAAYKLGLDAESVRAVNPDVIFCHVSSYGPQGHRADWPGYDQLFQSSCGWETMGAGEGNPPMWHRFGFMDHLCAMSSVVGTLVALFQLDRTGRATDVAASLLGAGVLTNSETFVRTDGSLADVSMLDGEQMMVAPGVRIVQMADGWIALAAPTDDQIMRLCQVAGVSDPDDLPTALRTRPSRPFLSALAEHDVSATAVRRDQRYPFFDEPANQAAGMVARYRHGEWGWLEQPGAAWNFGDLEVRLELAPPLLGEHTVEVLLEVGLDRAEIDELLAAGAAVALEQ